MERDSITEQIALLAQSSPAAVLTFSTMFKPMPLGKREIYDIRKEHSRSIFFLQSGLIHLYGKQQPQQQTMGIYRPNDFIITPGRIAPNSMPKLQIQALQPSNIFIAESHQIEMFLQTTPKRINLYHSIVQYYIENTLAHLQLLQSPTAAQRYQLMRMHFGKFLLQIPYQVQASYMGISRKHLSRIIQQQ